MYQINLTIFAENDSVAELVLFVQNELKDCRFDFSMFEVVHPESEGKNIVLQFVTKHSSELQKINEEILQNLKVDIYQKFKIASFESLLKSL